MATLCYASTLGLMLLFAEVNIFPRGTLFCLKQSVGFQFRFFFFAGTLVGQSYIQKHQSHDRHNENDCNGRV